MIATAEGLWAAARDNALADVRDFVSWCRPRRLRDMLAFAEAEIVLPSGPYEGLKWSRDMQPYVRLVYEELERQLYMGLQATGPSQSGKTLCMLVIPVLMHLFELGETVVVGVPTQEMANDKWSRDFQPVIERSRYERLLPARSKHLNADDPSIRFGNGSVLKFITAGGRDKKRAGFTTRVLAITETDDMDEAGQTSREGSKIAQLHARTNSYGDRRRIYEECTVSIEEGYIWQAYTKHSTGSSIVCPCPHCQQGVAPERENFVGARDASSEQEAAAAAHFVCPACGEPIDEDQRRQMNRAAELVHARESRMLGFRWSAFHNLFQSYSDLGIGEWQAEQAEDQELALKARRQFVWTLPYKPNLEAQVHLTLGDIIKRGKPPGRGLAPKGAVVTVFLDPGKYVCHWAAVGWYPGFRGQVIDYDLISVPCDRMPPEQALLTALQKFREIVEVGWAVEGESEERVQPAIVGVDSGYWTDVVYAFIRDCGVKMRPSPFTATKGFGAGQQRFASYSQPKNLGPTIRGIGDHWHLSHLKHASQTVLEFDADYWKTHLHERLATPIEGEGALTLYDAPPKEHMALARHITAEKAYQEFDPKRGMITLWKRISKDNHWLDCLAGCAVGAHVAEIRTLHEPTPAAAPPRRSALLARGLQRPDGRPW